MEGDDLERKNHPSGAPSNVYSFEGLDLVKKQEQHRRENNNIYNHDDIAGTTSSSITRPTRTRTRKNNANPSTNTANRHYSYPQAQYYGTTAASPTAQQQQQPPSYYSAYYHPPPPYYNYSYQQQQQQNPHYDTPTSSTQSQHPLYNNYSHPMYMMGSIFHGGGSSEHQLQDKHYMDRQAQSQQSTLPTEEQEPLLFMEQLQTASSSSVPLASHTYGAVASNTATTTSASSASSRPPTTTHSRQHPPPPLIPQRRRRNTYSETTTASHPHRRTHSSEINNSATMSLLSTTSTQQQPKQARPPPITLHRRSHSDSLFRNTTTTTTTPTHNRSRTGSYGSHRRMASDNFSVASSIVSSRIQSKFFSPQHNQWLFPIDHVHLSTTTTRKIPTPFSMVQQNPQVYEQYYYHGAEDDTWMTMMDQYCPYCYSMIPAPTSTHSLPLPQPQYVLQVSDTIYQQLCDDIVHSSNKCYTCYYCCLGDDSALKPSMWIATSIVLVLLICMGIVASL